MLALLRHRLGRRSGEGAAGPHTRDRALMARCLAYLYGGGSTLGLCSVVFFEPEPGVNVVGLLSTIAGGYFLTGIVIAGFDRISLRTFEVLSACGTALIALAIYFNGDPRNDNEMLYVLVTIFSFYFFTPRQAALQMIAMGGAYGWALLAIEGSNLDPSRWVIVMGSLLVAGLMVKALKRHVQALIDRLDETAQTDALTGLLNRRGFQRSFELEVERACRHGNPLSILVGDLDQFKTLNDCSGHQAGDFALRRFSALLRAAGRRIDTVARVGGEEFALLLPDTTAEGACSTAERVRRDVAGAFADEPVTLTVSFGIATMPDHGRTVEELLRAADQALYAAKELGRNRSVIYTPEVAQVLAGAAGRREAQGRGHVATMLSLAEALDARDSGTAAHSQTVGRYAEGMAAELGLHPARVERIRLAGILHDIGKIGVPDSILRKPGPLDDDEWATMRKHAETGARILEGTALEDVRGWVLAHHERPDGGGYPYGLPDQDIPLEAKILAVADAYEAMTSDRPYRSALGAALGAEELRRNAGTQFDPAVVEALITLLERRGELASAPPPPVASGAG